MAPADTRRSRSAGPWGLAWRRLRQNRAAMVGLGVFGVLVAAAVLAPAIAPFPYDEQSDDHMNEPPGATYWLGTDDLGRDLFSRLLWGARVSLTVGVVATAASVLIAVIVGAASAYFGGWVDALLMRITDSVFAFPDLLLAIGITAIFESPSLLVVFLALGVVGWPGMARVVRSQVLSLRTRQYVAAAEAAGASSARIVWRHLLPNCLGPIIVLATFRVAGTILAEAGLSFLGLGIQPPYPSWGSMLAESRHVFTLYPWMCYFPGGAIVVTVLGLNLLGDGLRDALDPRMKLPRS